MSTSVSPARAAAQAEVARSRPFITPADAIALACLLGMNRSDSSIEQEAA